LDSKVGKHLTKVNSVIDGNHIKSIKSANSESSNEVNPENNIEKYAMVWKFIVQYNNI